MSRFIFYSCCWCGLFGLSAAPVALADSLRLQNGEEVRGEIRKESIQGVTIASGGGARTYTRVQIAPDGVTYDNVPSQLRDGKEGLEARDFERAHRGFRALIQLAEAAAAPETQAQNGKDAKKKKPAPPPRQAAGTGVRPIFLQHALYGEVQTFAAEGKDSETVAAVDTLLDKVPDTSFLLEALLLQVRLSRGAAAVVEKAIRRASAAGAGAEVSDRIQLLKADNLAREGKPPDAQKIYRQLERSPVRSVSDSAKLGLAQIQLAGGDFVQAKIVFNGLVRESRDRAVLCAAARGLGDAQLKEMQGRRTVEGLREALETYTRAVILFFPGEGDPTEAHQAAILSAAQCAGEIVDLLKKDPKSKDTRAQEGFSKIARDNYQDLRSSYPRTEGAKLAAEALRRLSPSGS